MNRLLLFNPENDIALGIGKCRFTPPRQAALFHRAAAMIPFWLGDGDDCILIHPADIDAADKWIEDLSGVVGPRPVSCCNGEKWELCPWGWSYDTVIQFEKAGQSLLASNEKFRELERIRELSHRRSSLRFLHNWKNSGHPLHYNMPIEAYSIDEVNHYISENDRCVVKSPWSSSGRGVFPVSSATIKSSIARIEGIIRRQGSVMMEPLLPKLQDFAMLFNYRNGQAEFKGYSLFFNSTATNYGGNYIGSDDIIIKRLCHFITEDSLKNITNHVTQILPSVFGNDYQGPLGVDMMICKDDHSVWVAPCVEINLRYTMGFVAQGVWQKLKKEGVMSISPKVKSETDVKNGDKSLRLIPENEWFDVRFIEI